MQRRRRQEHYRREPSIDIKCLFNSVSGLVRESQWFHRPRRGGSCVWTVTVELDPLGLRKEDPHFRSHSLLVSPFCDHPIACRSRMT